MWLGRLRHASGQLGSQKADTGTDRQTGIHDACYAAMQLI